MIKKKLIVLVPAFPGEDGESYMVPFIQQFILAFSKRYHDLELTIYSLYIPQSKPFYWNNIRVIPLNGSRSFLLKPILIIRAFFKIANHLRKVPVDGILSFWYRETALVGNILSFIYSIKHYTWLQGQDVKKSNPYIKFLRPKTDSLIALSTYQNNFLHKDHGMRAQIVNPIAANPDFFPKLFTGQREIDILGAGSFIPLKNYSLFLTVIKELKECYEDIKVVLIGNGPLEKELEEFVIANNLQNNIEFPGLLSHKETLDYMNNAKLFLHTSNYEGGGMVLYESLYSGCQVVSTIPIEDNQTENFHYCSSRENLVSTLRNLINESKPTKRSSCTNIENTTKSIHDLFF